MTVRCCPACSREWAQVVSPDCVICQGRGTLQLGRAALARFPAEVVSRAVEFALEGSARDAMVRGGLLPRDARQVLTGTVRMLTTTGVLGQSDQRDPGRSTPGTPERELREQAADLAHETTGVTVESGDWSRLARPPFKFDVDDRPLAEPGLPEFSAGGHVAYYARVCDELDPLTTSTRQVTLRRRVVDDHARILVGAAVEAEPLVNAKRKTGATR